MATSPLLSPTAPPPAGVTYFITDLPAQSSTGGSALHNFVEYFSLKRNCGGAGEVVKKDCLMTDGESMLLTYEKASDSPRVMEYSHNFDGRKAKLQLMLEERVSVVYQGDIFRKGMINMEEAKQQADRDDIDLRYHDSELHVRGNWHNIGRFRQFLKMKMVESLKQNGKDDFISQVQAAAALPLASCEDSLPIASTSSSPAQDGVIALPSAQDGVIALPNFSSDVLALMQKCDSYHSDHMIYHISAGGVTISCPGDHKLASGIADEFQLQYRQLLMSGKLKEHSFPIPSSFKKPQVDGLVAHCNNTFAQSVFKFDEQNNAIKCIALNSRHMSHVNSKMKDLLQLPPAAVADTTTCMCLTLADGKKITLKLANLVEEAVDVIVNAANERLAHGAGVAFAINKASGGVVQSQSSAIFQKSGMVPTGQVVVTAAGGNLKCSHVIHAVGPDQHKHGDRCEELLRNCCVSALQQADKLEACSIAFPPISSGIYGVPKDVVARVLFNTLCNTSTQVRDIRIVIIDKQTFEHFVPVFANRKAGATADSCPICLNNITDKVTTSCRHSYCRVCLNKALKAKPYCPLCNCVLRPVTGDQPAGHMTYLTVAGALPGYDPYGTIMITYDIPNGTQGQQHANPGRQYSGAKRVAYLPDSLVGRKVLGLLKKAFDAKLVFTIGTSATSGRPNCVVWNDIHHKTNMAGGPDQHGYPDPTYLARVTAELKYKGIM